MSSSCLTSAPAARGRSAGRGRHALAALLPARGRGQLRPARAAAQAKLRFSDAPAGTKNPTYDLLLRPNVPREVFLHVENEGGPARKLKVELVAADQVVATADVAV